MIAAFAVCYTVLLFVSDWGSEANVCAARSTCRDIDAVVIPGGLTLLIQTLDVSINRPLEEDATDVGELDDWRHTITHSRWPPSNADERDACTLAYGCMAWWHGGWHHVWSRLSGARGASRQQRCGKLRVTKTGTRVGHCEFKQLFTLLLPSVGKRFGKILHLKPHPNFAVAITMQFTDAIL